MGRYSLLSVDIMTATIEKSLARILEAMKGIKNCISDLKIRNMRPQQLSTQLQPNIVNNPLYSVKNRWIAFDISFFDPHFNSRLVDMAEAIDYSGKDIYYRNMFVFLDYIKDYAKT